MNGLRRFVRGLWPDQRGVQAVEFALLLPILCLLVFGIIDFGRAYFSWITITSGAREGVRSAAVGKPDSAIIARVQDAVSGLNVASVQTGTCTSSAEGVLCITADNVGGNPGESVTVYVRYNFGFIIFPQIMSWVGGSSVSTSVPLTAQATMRLE